MMEQPPLPDIPSAPDVVNMPGPVNDPTAPGPDGDVKPDIHPVPPPTDPVPAII
jgi:hypothetical protein